MKKKVYDYFLAYPDSTHHMCARELLIPEAEILDCIDKMCSDGLLTIQGRPLGNEIDPNCSIFYSVRKPYHD